ncbi:MAG: M14 family zinc carboxypeptidase, partial [Oscillospiraceae bacterium]
SGSAGWRKKRVDKIMQSSSKKWQANVRGVDLNHNFNAGFPLLQKLERKSGICGPAAGRYGGRRPESEPESRNLATFIRHSNIYRLFSFHSQGEEIFYEYGNIPVPQGTEIAEILSKLSGYRLVQNDGLYSHGGLKDWFIKEFHRPGFTIEIGKGENPLPLSDLAPIYKKLRRMMAAGVIL